MRIMFNKTSQSPRIKSATLFIHPLTTCRQGVGVTAMVFYPLTANHYPLNKNCLQKQAVFCLKINEILYRADYNALIDSTGGFLAA